MHPPNGVNNNNFVVVHIIRSHFGLDPLAKGAATLLALNAREAAWIAQCAAIIATGGKAVIICGAVHNGIDLA